MGLRLVRSFRHALFRCSFESGVRLELYKDASLFIGNGTYINRNVQLVVAESVSIG
jgi:hypothetical protein